MSRPRKPQRRYMSAEQYALSGAEQEALRGVFRAYKKFVGKVGGELGIERVPIDRVTFNARWTGLSAHQQEVLCMTFTLNPAELVVLLKRHYMGRRAQTILNAELDEDLFWALYHFRRRDRRSKR